VTEPLKAKRSKKLWGWQNERNNEDKYMGQGEKEKIKLEGGGERKEEERVFGAQL